MNTNHTWFSLNYLWISTLLLCLISPGIVIAQEFSPLFFDGAHWRVKAEYIQPEDGPRRAGTIFWNFNVSRLAQSVENYYYLLTVDSDSEKNLPKASMYFNRSSQLEKVVVYRQRRGKMYTKIYSGLKEKPFFADETILPIDFPVMPLIISETKKVVVREKIGEGLFVNRVVKQDVLLLDEFTSPDNKKDETKYLEVKCYSKKEFTQRWNPSYPWPVSGKNSTMDYYLVLP